MADDVIRLIKPDVLQLLGTDELLSEYEAEASRREMAHKERSGRFGSGPVSAVTPTVEDLLASQELVQAFDDASAAIEAGHLVRTVRKKAGLSQITLAKRLAISQARVSAIETGVGTEGPTYGLLRRVASACGTSLPIMFSGIEMDKHSKV